MVDGVFAKHKISKKTLRKLLSELKGEKERLKALGVKVNPPSIFERRNKSSKKGAQNARAVTTLKEDRA